MKKRYVKDFLNSQHFTYDQQLYCWIKNKSIIGGIIFIELEDSTGSIDVIAEKKVIGIPSFTLLTQTPVESSIDVVLSVKKGKRKSEELFIKKIKVINKASIKLSPSPRQIKDPFAKNYINEIQNKRHLFIRNRKISSIFRIKHQMLIALREWLNNNQFIEVDTPILTQTNLYDNKNTFETDYFGTRVYLSQCAGLYLGAMIPAFEKVYTITPAFRKESSKSPRHNPEFYHLKGQISFYNIEDTMRLIEEMLYHTVSHISKFCSNDLDILNIKINPHNYFPPYPTITYENAIKILKSEGVKIEFGQSLNEKTEQYIANMINKPVFVMNIPSTIEPFPYKYGENENYTKTADLLIPDGYGEILGIAEFIYEYDELQKRIAEKNKGIDENHLQWYTELSQFGDIPRSGFGIGIERLLRAILKISHIRDCFLFPRLYDRQPYP